MWVIFMKHHDFKTKLLKDSEIKQAYDALEEEFALFEKLLEARQAAGLTQADVAERMGTKAPAVARLESGGGRKKHSPSLETLRKYANAVGCQLDISLRHIAS